MMMKCIQGKIPFIDEADTFYYQNIFGDERRQLVAKYLDYNPLFKGQDHPTNDDRWNRWYYVGPKHEN